VCVVWAPKRWVVGTRSLIAVGVGKIGPETLTGPEVRTMHRVAMLQGPRLGARAPFAG
jgi:hypothetical protein